jgi:hypothetical protein
MGVWGSRSEHSNIIDRKNAHSKKKKKKKKNKKKKKKMVNWVQVCVSPLSQCYSSAWVGACIDAKQMSCGDGGQWRREML